MNKKDIVKVFKSAQDKSPSALLQAYKDYEEDKSKLAEEEKKRS